MKPLFKVILLTLFIAGLLLFSIATFVKVSNEKKYKYENDPSWMAVCSEPDQQLEIINTSNGFIIVGFEDYLKIKIECANRGMLNLK